ncbi:UPF0052-domain-containing protein, partial [Nadsonia fulvescens var. elongata DSM 6958]
VLVISGGTATNCIVSVFASLARQSATYVMPISDNGGSTSEILRVIGGPAIGDIRSRITRLIPSTSRSKPLQALFSLRLPRDAQLAKAQWIDLVEGTHPLWHDVESHYRDLIRPFFIHVHTELLKRARPGKEFRFEAASIGNLFLTGARLFFGSLDSAIELLLRINLISESVHVLPALNTNFTHNISASLTNGQLITGQNQISHPQLSLIPATITSEVDNINLPPLASQWVDSEDAHLPFTHPDLKLSQIHFDKNVNHPLPAPIERIFYINPYGQEIFPRAGSRVLKLAREADIIVYSIGSLYTSLVPVLILEGVADAIVYDAERESKLESKKKVLILNGCKDRETETMSGVDMVIAIIQACYYSLHGHHLTKPEILERKEEIMWHNFITDVIFLENTILAPDEVDYLQEQMTINCHKVPNAD